MAIRGRERRALAAFPPGWSAEQRAADGRVGVDAETGNNDAMDDNAILDQIHQLVTEEKRLRHQAGGLTGADRTRLDTLERQLDQAWDLLRQRRAREDAGEDPDVARERPADEVEGYLQ